MEEGLSEGVLFSVFRERYSYIYTHIYIYIYIYICTQIKFSGKKRKSRTDVHLCMVDEFQGKHCVFMIWRVCPRGVC